MPLFFRERPYHRFFVAELSLSQRTGMAMVRPVGNVGMASVRVARTIMRCRGNRERETNKNEYCPTEYHCFTLPGV